MMWPAPVSEAPPPPPKPTAKSVAAAEAANAGPPNYFNVTLKDAFMYTAGLSSLVGKYSMPKNISKCYHFTVIPSK